MKESVTVEWHDEDFEVEGTWNKPRGARITLDPTDSEPADGGTFGDDATITLGGVDMTDLFGEMVLSADAKAGKTTTVYDHIIAAAEEGLASRPAYAERTAA